MILRKSTFLSPSPRNLPTTRYVEEEEQIKVSTNPGKQVPMNDDVVAGNARKNRRNLPSPPTHIILLLLTQPGGLGGDEDDDDKP